MLQKASREAKPFKAHRSQLERRRERLQKQQDRDTSEIAKAQEEMSELQAKIASLQTAVDERARTIKDVTSELTELVRKSITEGSEGGDGGDPPGGQEDSPWSKMAAAIKGLESLPGIPSEFTNLLARVQEAAAAVASMASPTVSNGGGGGAGQPASGQPAAATPTPPNATSTDPPVVLAPHGRFSKGAAKAAAPSPPRTKPPPIFHIGEGDGKAQCGEGGGDSKSTPAAAPESDSGAAARGGGAAAHGGAKDSANEARPEEDAMQVDIESSLAKLPEQDQRKLRAVLGRGRDRGKNAARGEEDEEDTRRDERERSPRPTKGSEGKEL